MKIESQLSQRKKTYFKVRFGSAAVRLAYLYILFLQKAFLLAYFRGSLFSEELVIGRNFVFQNGFGLSIKTPKNTKISSKQLTVTLHGLIFWGAAYYHNFTGTCLRFTIV